MRYSTFVLFTSTLCAMIFCTLVTSNHCDAQSADKIDDNWHQFRGPRANGFAPKADPPTTWDSSKNVKWKVDLPGSGTSTPIVWEDKIFVTTAIKTEKIDPDKPKPEDQPRNPFGIKSPINYYEFQVLCINRSNGKTIWKKTANNVVPHEGTHRDNTYATATPTTDGERIYVPFGSQGFFCYDFKGNLIWKRDFGAVKTRLSFGEAASLTLFDDKLIIIRDNDEQSTINVLNAKTGKTIWQKDRDESSAWATPVVVSKFGKKQVITNSKNFVRSYDLENGDLIWKCDGQVSNVTPSPIVRDDFVVCMSGYRGSAARAIKLDSKGDVSDNKAQTVWQFSGGTPYVPSPTLYEDNLYFTQSNQGIISCVNVKTGEKVFKRSRLENVRGLYASLVCAAGKIYVTSRDGTVVVLKHGDEMKVLSVNKLGDRLDATPVLVGKEIFLRSRTKLYCISEQ